MDQTYTFEQIEAYLDDELSAEERAAFEVALKNKPGLQEEVRAHQATRRAVEAYASQRTHDRVSKIFASQQKQQRPGFSTGMLRIAAAVALVLAMGIAYFYLQAPNAAQLAEDYLEPYPDRITTMGQNDANALATAIQAYNQAQYDEAIAAFQQIPPGHPQQPLIDLYIGVSALETGRTPLARSALQPLAEQAGDYQAAARWYLALAYLKEGDTAAARPLLNLLITADGYKAESARRLLDRLER
jgi:hypothetical protein